MQKSIKEGIQKYNEIANRNNQLLTNLVNPNQVDSSIVKTVSYIPYDKNKSQFSLEPIMGNPNLFTTNPSNPQQVLIKNTTLTFLGSGNLYDLNDSDLQYFITNTKLDREINNKNVIYCFLNDMNYDIKYGDKKSMKYYFIKELYSRNQQSAQLPHWGNTIDNNQEGSGLNGEATREAIQISTSSSHLIQMN